MYKIPNHFNPLNLKDQKIYQVAFGINFVTLLFDRGFIQFSGGFSFGVIRNLKSYVEVYPANIDFGLLKLLEKTILDVLINVNRNEMTIMFNDGHILVLTGNDFFESFLVCIDETEFRV